jgi:hypothetical protein
MTASPAPNDGSILEEQSLTMLCVTPHETFFLVTNARSQRIKTIGSVFQLPSKEKTAPIAGTVF